MIGVLKFFGTVVHTFHHDNYCLDYLPPGDLVLKPGTTAQLYAVSDLGPKHSSPLDPLVNEVKFNRPDVDNFLKGSNIIVRYVLKVKNFEKASLEKIYEDVYVEDVDAQAKYVFDDHPNRFTNAGGYIYLVPNAVIMDWYHEIVDYDQYMMAFIEPPPGCFSSMGVFLMRGSSAMNVRRFNHMSETIGARIDLQFLPQVNYAMGSQEKYDMQNVNLSKHPELKFITDHVQLAYFQKFPKLDYQGLLTKAKKEDVKGRNAAFSHKLGARIKHSDFQDRIPDVKVDEVPVKYQDLKKFSLSAWKEAEGRKKNKKNKNVSSPSSSSSSSPSHISNAGFQW